MRPGRPRSTRRKPWPRMRRLQILGGDRLRPPGPSRTRKKQTLNICRLQQAPPDWAAHAQPPPDGRPTRALGVSAKASRSRAQQPPHARPPWADTAKAVAAHAPALAPSPDSGQAATAHTSAQCARQKPPGTPSPSPSRRNCNLNLKAASAAPVRDPSPPSPTQSLEKPRRRRRRRQLTASLGFEAALSSCCAGANVKLKFSRLRRSCRGPRNRTRINLAAAHAPPGPNTRKPAAAVPWSLSPAAVHWHSLPRP